MSDNIIALCATMHLGCTDKRRWWRAIIPTRLWNSKSLKSILSLRANPTQISTTRSLSGLYQEQMFVSEIGASYF
jgi:hypothetical protein